MSSASCSWYKVPMEEMATSGCSLVAYSDSSDEEVEEAEVHVFPVAEEEEEEETRRKRLYSAFRDNFSHETIEEAIRVCGARAPEEELVDFMLALPHAASPVSAITDSRDSAANGSCSTVGRACSPPDTSVTENSSPDLGTRKAAEMELSNMGFTDKQVSVALNSCGTGTSLETKIAFIFAMEGEDEEEEPVLDVLIKFGYSEDAASKAIEACGSEDVDVLVDYMDAHTSAHTSSQDASSSMSEEDDEPEDLDDLVSDYERVMQQNPLKKKKKKKRKRSGSFSHSGKPKKRPKEVNEEPKEVNEEPKNVNKEPKKPVGALGTLSGFSLPGQHVIPRSLTSEQKMLPYFYFENVRSMPKGEWDNIKRFLYNIDPEFVCASHFSVTRRPRGYVHNLPIEGRTQVLPLPPMTIRDFLPNTSKFIPVWDTRTKLNTISTSSGMTFAAKARADLKANPIRSEEKRKEIMCIAKKWNLVWTGKEHCAPLEPHEIERALGFEEYHTRGLFVSDRFKALGNSFQTDVVAYHLSPLKTLFPDGIRVLSLFAGIGGAEVALHKAGIRMKFVVSVEIREENIRVLERWWSSSGQEGKHVIIRDVQNLTRAKLQELMIQGGGPFDLVIGGSPCNNLSGCNRISRTGLAGDKSSLFYEFPRIVNLLRAL